MSTTTLHREALPAPSAQGKGTFGGPAAAGGSFAGLGQVDGQRRGRPCPQLDRSTARSFRSLEAQR